MYKKLSASGVSAPEPRWGLRPQTPFRLALRALAMVRPPLWQILDPPLLIAICLLYISCNIEHMPVCLSVFLSVRLSTLL